MVFPVVMYRCENWTIKKAEHRRIDAPKLWCWRRLLSFEEHIETLPETIAKLEKITSSDLLEIANDIYDKNKVNLLIFKNQDD